MLDEKVKHLEFIQNIINRMNSNSFYIKVWTVTVVSAILAIYASTKNCNFVLVAIFPSVIFWFLDTYYLTQERRFRALYNDAAGVTDNPKQIKAFEMRPDFYTEGKFKYCEVFFSTTIIMLYLPLIITLVTIYTYLKLAN